MVYKIVWTQKALDSYLKNIHYLENQWTNKEVQAFILLVEDRLDTLCQQPNTGKIANERMPNIRRIVLHKRVLMIYRIQPRQKNIQLLLFWNTYQNPHSLKI